MPDLTSQLSLGDITLHCEHFQAEPLLKVMVLCSIFSFLVEQPGFRSAAYASQKNIVIIVC